MKKWITPVKKYGLLIFIGFHLLSILLVCIYYTVNGYLDFYYPDQKKYKEQAVFKWVRYAGDNPILDKYRVLSGTDAGYGFFAPNVSSEYILEFNLLDKNNKATAQQLLPPFTCKESVQRYTTLLGSFQEKLKQLESGDTSKARTLHMRYLDALVTCIGRNIIKRSPGVSRVVAVLYLYDYPSLRDYRKGNRAPKNIYMQKFDITAPKNPS